MVSVDILLKAGHSACSMSSWLHRPGTRISLPKLGKKSSGELSGEMNRSYHLVCSLASASKGHYQQKTSPRRTNLPTIPQHCAGQ